MVFNYHYIVQLILFYIVYTVHQVWFSHTARELTDCTPESIYYEKVYKQKRLLGNSSLSTTPLWTTFCTSPPPRTYIVDTPILYTNTPSTSISHARISDHTQSVIDPVEFSIFTPLSNFWGRRRLSINVNLIS